MIGDSAQMFAELTFRYEVSILERFGLKWYGCCGRLDIRWHVVEQIASLRRIAVARCGDRGEDGGNAWESLHVPDETQPDRVGDGHD